MVKRIMLPLPKGRKYFSAEDPKDSYLLMPQIKEFEKGKKN